MTVRKTVGTVGTLAQGAVSTAVSVARHPIGSTALVAGFVKGAAEAGISLVRGTGSTSGPQAVPDLAPDVEPDIDSDVVQEAAVVEEPETSEVSSDPRDDLPGPDLVATEVPDPADLPEPIVIEALDEPGESFHTEPKAASRDSDHGGQAGDREEASGYVEEIPDPFEEAQDATPVWTSESSVDEPLEPVFDEAAAKAVTSEADILRKAADQHVE